MTENIADVPEIAVVPHLRKEPRPKNTRAKAVIDGIKNTLIGASGFVLLAVIWQILAQFRELPSVLQIAHELGLQLAHPFRSEDVNDLGIGLLTSYSLFRVCAGFVLGSLVAIPLGFLIGSSPLFKRAFSPVIETLRPISPIAWIPIGLALLKTAPMAAIFVIFITSLWPTLINTAFGVASLPDDYKNVARVFQFSRSKYVRKILLPFALPHIITGLRLSMGIAWLVIVAAEMLSTVPGIGGFVWESWNSLMLTRVISAILIIGVIGLLIDRSFEKLHRKYAYGA